MGLRVFVVPALQALLEVDNLVGEPAHLAGRCTNELLVFVVVHVRVRGCVGVGVGGVGVGGVGGGFGGWGVGDWGLGVGGLGLGSDG